MPRIGLRDEFVAIALTGRFARPRLIRFNSQGNYYAVNASPQTMGVSYAQQKIQNQESDRESNIPF
jgi:spermidine/putrescine-binding protein